MALNVVCQKNNQLIMTGRLRLNIYFVLATFTTIYKVFAEFFSKIDPQTHDFRFLIDDF